MNPKLPSRIMTLGVLALGVSLAVKELAFLSILGRSAIFEWGCGLVTALSFSTGIFLSLYGLISQTDRRRQFFTLHLIGLLTFCSMLGLYFFGYVVFSKLGAMPNEIPNVLPKLVEKAGTAGTERDRQLMAENAYRIYGVPLAYRRDSGDWACYQPTGEDITYHDQMEKDKARDQELWDSMLNDHLRQFPWLFGLYLGSFFIVYLMGSLWLLSRNPGPRP